MIALQLQVDFALNFKQGLAQEAAPSCVKPKTPQFMKEENYTNVPLVNLALHKKVI